MKLIKILTVLLLIVTIAGNVFAFTQFKELEIKFNNLQNDILHINKINKIQYKTDSLFFEIINKNNEQTK